jgi:hypothetical protein
VTGSAPAVVLPSGRLRRRVRRPFSRVRTAFVAPARSGGEFDEIWGLRSAEIVAGMRRAGADVVVLPLDSNEPVSGVDFISAPQLNHVLEGMVRSESPVFHSGLPATMVWDDPLGALALSLVWRRQGRMGWRDEEPSDDDVLAGFRDVMSAPGTQHFAWDRGHVDAVVELGLAPRESIEWYPISTYAPFLEQGRVSAIEPHIDVAFAGNLWESLLAESNYAREPFFVELTDRIVRRKLADLRSSSWDVFCSELDALPEQARRDWGLRPSLSAFWDYYLYAIWFAINSRVRIELMTSIEHPVDVFGVFADPGSRELLGGYPNLRFRGYLNHSTELPATYAATKVNVCITNALIYRGVPTKLIDCVASGGFALVDPKDDLIELFGPEVEAIFFRDADELNAKLEYFLARPEERREIVAALRGVIEARQAPGTLARRIVDRRVDEGRRLVAA